MLDGAVLPLTEETLWAVYVLPDERVSVNAIRPVYVMARRKLKSDDKGLTVSGLFLHLIRCELNCSD